MAAVRFVLTSDLALRSDRPERFRLLDETLAAAREFGAGLIAVAGDLFADPEPSPALLEAARDRFDAAGIATAVVAGDRDHGLSRIAARRADVLGPHVRVLAEAPCERARIGDMDVVGLPFQDGPTAGECLAGVAGDPTSTIVVAHAALAGTSTASGLAMPLLANELEGRFALAVLGCGQPGPGRLRKVGAATTAALTTDHALLGELLPGQGFTIARRDETARPTPTDLVVHLLPGRENQALGELARRLAAARLRAGPGELRIHGGSTLAPEAWGTSLAALLRGASAALGASPAELENDPRLPILQQIDFFPDLAASPILRDLVKCIDRLAQPTRDATDDASETQNERAAVVAEACRLGLVALAAEHPAR